MPSLNLFFHKQDKRYIKLFTDTIQKQSLLLLNLHYRRTRFLDLGGGCGRALNLFQTTIRSRTLFRFLISILGGLRNGQLSLLVELKHVLKSLPRSLLRHGGIFPFPLSFASEESNGLAHRRGRDLRGAQEGLREGFIHAPSAVFVDGGAEEGEAVGVAARRTAVRRGLGVSRAVDVSDGVAIVAGDAAGLVRRGGVVEGEAGGAKRRRVVAEEAVRAVEAEDAAETSRVYDPGVLAFATAARLRGNRPRRRIRRLRS